MVSAAGGNQYPHLEVMREDVSSERKTRQGFPGQRPNRGGRTSFAPRLFEATERILEQQTHAVAVAGVRPHLVFRVPLVKGADPQAIEQLLRQSGIAVVSIEPDRAVIAFRHDTDLSEFQNAIEEYKQGPRINPRTNQSFASTKYDVLEWIEPESMQLWGRADRIGERLSEEVGSDGTRIQHDQIYTLDLEMWHPGTLQAARDALDDVRKLFGASGMAQVAILDHFVGETLALARIKVPGRLLDKILDFPIIAEVELPPKADFDPVLASQVTRRNFPTPPRPPADGPRVCVIDTGITSNHPLLASNVGAEEAIFTKEETAADANGHGTMVGGLVIFGDVRQCYEDSAFASPITLFSARVLNENKTFDDERLIINQMRQAIQTFIAPPNNCRVFNISIGGNEPVLASGRGRQTQWAEALDLLARELKVLIIVSAGNHHEADAFKLGQTEEVLNSYPSLLFRPGAQLCDPATATIAITVGAIAQHDVIGARDEYKSGDIALPIAKKMSPSPMTRTGPGLNGGIKPEFVHYGGNLAVLGTGTTRFIGKEPGTAVMSFARQTRSGLFAYDIGTSFAAPQVARIAALVEHQLTGLLGQVPHPNLVRVILANSADIPLEIQALLAKNGDAHAAIKACGYGLPNEDLALQSSERRVTLFAQGRIKLGKFGYFHIIRVPMAEGFRLAHGQRKITAALAYDPPVRRRRQDYFGVEMDMYLIRGKSIEEVHQAFAKAPPNSEPGSNISSPYRVDLEPKSSCRKGGYNRGKSTLQRASFTMKGKQHRDYGSDCWLVVQARRLWAPPEVEEQDYAVAITLEAESPDLYVQVRDQIQQRARGRVRV